MKLFWSLSISLISHFLLFILLTNLNYLIHFGTSLRLVKEIVPILIIVRPTISTVKSPPNRDQKGPTIADPEIANVLISNANLPKNSDETFIDNAVVDSTAVGTEFAEQTITIKYPQLSRLNHEEGTTYLVLKDKSAVLVQSSGFSRLDAEAISAVQQLVSKQKVHDGQKYKVQFRLD